MKRTLIIIAPKDFKDEEYYHPKEVLEKGGVQVITASLEKTAISVSGVKLPTPKGVGFPS